MRLDSFINPNVVIVHSIGYEGKEIDYFISQLIDNEVTRIIDVRQNPFSNTKGFGQFNLKPKLLQNGILYIHYPLLAPPDSLRKKYKEKKDFNAFAFEFIRYIESKGIDNLKNWGKELKNGDCLLCFEKSDRYCHRRLLYPYIPHQMFPIK